MLELINELEYNFEILIDFDDVDKFIEEDTIKVCDIVNYIAKKSLKK